MARYASTFMSHSWKQKPFVEDIARELVRRGMLAWLDANELPVGVDLDIELRKSNDAQLTLTAFLSEESLASEWCKKELEPRLARADSGKDSWDTVLPVFLGVPFDLVSRSPELRSRWLTPDGARVRRLGIAVDDLSRVNQAEIARRLVQAHFRQLGTREAREVMIVLDQRGKGRRTGDPQLPPRWSEQPWPVLVFRPDMQERSEAEVLDPIEWIGVRDAMAEAIADALGTRVRREVYVTGNAQLALAWLVGQHVDRSSGAKLVVHNSRFEQTLLIDFNDERYLLPLPRLDPAEVSWHEGVAPSSSAGAVSLYLGAPAYAKAVLSHRESSGDTTPLAMRETGIIKTPDDVIVLARWIATAAAQRPITLYTGLPFHVLPLLAALLKHEVGPVTVMEWDRASNAYRAYSISG